MAEVLGVVASGITIVQIGGQLMSCVQRLRELNRSIRNVPEELESTLLEIEGFGQVLSSVEHLHLPDQGLDLLQSRLQACRTAAASLEVLIRRASQSFNNGSGFRAGVRLRVVMKKEEIKKLKEKMDSANKMLSLAMQCYLMMMTQRQTLLIDQLNAKVGDSALPPSGSGDKIECEHLNPEPAKVLIRRHLRYSPGRRCGIKKCCCTCHDTTLFRGRSWSIELPMLSSFWNPCNSSSCANATSASIWVGLRQIGIPWTVYASMNITWSSQQFCMAPSLSFQRVVEYDSPGFKLLRELRKGHVKDWDEARAELENLFGSGKASPLDIDPDGQTWLEKLLDYPWYKGNMHIQFAMIPFLAQLGTQMSTKRLLYKSAEWIGEGPHLDLIKDLIVQGFDASEIEAPSFLTWPLPHFGDETGLSLPMGDPFFIEWISENLKVCPGFAGMNPLLEAILIEAEGEVERLIANDTLSDQNNLLGQSALHLAVFRSQHLRLLLESKGDVNAKDKHGMTPVMYAMATGNSPVAIELLEAGADPFLGDDSQQSAFTYAQSQGNWNTIVEIISHFRNYPQGTEEAKIFVQFWLTLGVLLSLQGDLFGRKREDLEAFLGWGADPNSTIFGDTFAHRAKDEAELELLINHGFNKFENKDKTGAHALIVAAKQQNPRMVELLLKKSSSVNQPNHDGHTALHLTIQNSGDAAREYNGWHPDDCTGIIKSMSTLLKNGANPLLCDSCRCACSRSGCTASTMLVKETEPSEWVRRPNDILAAEFLKTVKETKGSTVAKKCLLDMLRVLEFEKEELTHTCCRRSETNDSSMRMLDDDDVEEIRYEESELIEALEHVMRQVELSLEDDVDAAIASSGILVQLKARTQENTKTIGSMTADGIRDFDFGAMISLFDDFT